MSGHDVALFPVSAEGTEVKTRTWDNEANRTCIPPENHDWRRAVRKRACCLELRIVCGKVNERGKYLGCRRDGRKIVTLIFNVLLNVQATDSGGAIPKPISECPATQGSPKA